MADVIHIFQKGFNYSQDGPGNRLVYHLHGCNLTCPWCSNPEGLHPNKNTVCLTADDVVKEALSCRMMFFDGGGVTLTGGEVTCSKDAVLTIIKELKKHNIHTCIETNASLENCEKIFEEVDFMIADYKSPFKFTLKEFTGADLDIIEKNLLLRAKTQKPLLVRVPLIGFFNKGVENATAFCKFFKRLADESGNKHLSFEILTYHEYGKDKYEKLSKDYTVTDGFVTPEDVRILTDEIKKHNLKLINT